MFYYFDFLDHFSTPNFTSGVVCAPTKPFPTKMRHFPPAASQTGNGVADSGGVKRDADVTTGSGAGAFQSGVNLAQFGAIIGVGDESSSHPKPNKHAKHGKGIVSFTRKRSYTIM